MLKYVAILAVVVYIVSVVAPGVHAQTGADCALACQQTANRDREQCLGRATTDGARLLCALNSDLASQACTGLCPSVSPSRAASRSLTTTRTMTAVSDPCVRQCISSASLIQKNCITAGLGNCQARYDLAVSNCQRDNCVSPSPSRSVSRSNTQSAPPTFSPTFIADPCQRTCVYAAAVAQKACIDAASLSPETCATNAGRQAQSCISASCPSGTPSRTITATRTVTAARTLTPTVVVDLCDRQCVYYADQRMRTCLAAAVSPSDRAACETLRQSLYAKCRGSCVSKTPSPVASVTRSLTLSKTASVTPGDGSCSYRCVVYADTVYRQCLNNGTSPSNSITIRAAAQDRCEAACRPPSPVVSRSSTPSRTMPAGVLDPRTVCINRCASLSLTVFEECRTRAANSAQFSDCTKQFNAHRTACPTRCSS